MTPPHDFRQPVSLGEGVFVAGDAGRAIGELHKTAEKAGRDPKTLSVTFFGAPPDVLLTHASNLRELRDDDAARLITSRVDAGDGCVGASSCASSCASACGAS